MGRPKGSKNKPKDGESPPAAGHNSELSEAERRALLLKGIVGIEEMLVEKNTIVADIRNARKKMIAQGFEAFEIDYAIKLRKNKESDEIERRRREAIIARFLNHPIGTQVDLFDDNDRTPAVDRAAAEGEIAGAEGKSCVSPYQPGTEQEQHWIQGWHRAQDNLASGFKKLEEADSVDADEELEAA